MSNPAAELLDIFTSWAEHAPSNLALSEIREIRTEAGIEESFRAMAALNAIPGRIDWLEQQGQRVDRMRACIPKWTHIVLGVDLSWSSAVDADSTFPRADMDNLAHLASLLDIFEGQAPESVLTELRSRLQGIREVLDSDDTLETFVKARLRVLLAEFETLLDGHPTGAEVRAGYEDIKLAMFAARDQSKKKPRWTQALGKWLADTTQDVLAAIAQGGASGISQGMIGPM